MRAVPAHLPGREFRRRHAPMRRGLRHQKFMMSIHSSKSAREEKGSLDNGAKCSPTLLVDNWQNYQTARPVAHARPDKPFSGPLDSAGAVGVPFAIPSSRSAIPPAAGVLFLLKGAKTCRDTFHCPHQKFFLSVRRQRSKLF